MQRVTLKTSTIFISKGDHTRVYRSVGEIPEGLRKELEQSTNGFNSATILIADRRGREEVRRALKGMPSALRRRFAPAMETPAAVAPTIETEAEIHQIPTIWEHARAHWPKIAVPLGIALATWAALSLR
ncbi:MAG: hypothetical protein ABIR70_12310 [Bryobacteraceae bacterium]